MPLSIDELQRAFGRAFSAKQIENARAVLDALDHYGDRLGIDTDQKRVHLLAQCAHESMWFVYDREIWGPTAQQQRYERDFTKPWNRDDPRNSLAFTLGNSAQGDGAFFRGYTGMQVTGRANTVAFRDWCRMVIGGPVPDFAVAPDLMCTTPWEGLAPLWYWDARKLNAKIAVWDDLISPTRAINGRTNGLADRRVCFGKIAMVVLNYDPTRIGVTRFQAHRGIICDGDLGPNTRAALHTALGEIKGRPAPVTLAASTAPAAASFWSRIFGKITA